MKAISLWQPWASAIALGSKTIETRHWSTNYRGPIAIHASKRFRLGELIHFNSCWNWQGAMRALGVGWGNDKPSLADPGILPLGAIVAVARLDECRRTEDFRIIELKAMRHPEDDTAKLYGWTEEQMGNFEIGRYGWVLSHIQRLKTPIPFVGRQGFFDVPDSLLRGAVDAK